MGKTVLVGMSGGVDSSVAAAILKKQGYNVIGFTLNLWSGSGETESSRICCSLEAVEDARSVCTKLDIPYYVFNFKDLFKEKIVTNFLCEYEKGRTPNPCVECNRYIKFGAMLERLKAIGGDYIATGHYASVGFDEKSNRYYIKKSKDTNKDQTYMLYTLSQDCLSHLLLPLGEHTKDKVREKAAALGFNVASKVDSQDICFLEGKELDAFIEEYAPSQLKMGEIVDTYGNLLGFHKGISVYTVGQRRGLNISSMDKLYVKELDSKTNRIILAPVEELFKSTLIAENINFIPFDKLENEIKIQAKIRYAAKPEPVTIYPEGDSVRVVFDAPQRAITKGQAVVFYDGEYLVGGGTIKDVL